MPNPDPRPLPTEPPDSGSANKPPITEPDPDRLPDEAPEPNPDENDGVPKTAGRRRYEPQPGGQSRRRRPAQGRFSPTPDAKSGRRGLTRRGGRPKRRAG